MPRRRPNPGGIAALRSALAIAFLLPAGARAQEDLPSELESISAVRLVGRHHVPIKEIRAVLKTRAPSLLPWREKPIMRRDFLQADTLTIEGVYRQHGYLDARAHYRLDPGRSRNTVVVTFRIEEGPRSRIASVELDGVRALPEAALRKKLYARPGRPFNPLYLVADTTRISAAYKEKGHLPHIVASSHREGLRVTVRYAVNEGPVYRYGQVYISSPGELHVRERLIRRELLLKPDDVYRASRVQRSIERLYDSGFFSQVQMTPLVDSTNTRVEFDLRVRERKPRWIDAGVGSGTAERLRFTGEWGHRNLNGRGLQGVLSSKLALDGQARFLLSRGDASLLEPWLLRSRTRGLINGYYEKDHDRADPRWVAKVETRGVSVQLRRELGRFAHIALTQDNAFVNQIYAFEHPVADSTLESLAVFVPRNYTTHRLQLSGDRDTRDDPLNPGHGSAQSATADVAGGPLQGASSFTKFQFLSTWYTPARQGWILATRIRAGTIQPFGRVASLSPGVDPQVARVPLGDRFRIGGVSSLRGYDENQIPSSGGLAVIQANAELRIPLVGPFGLEVYVDAGNVWDRAAYIRGEDFVPRISDRPLTPNNLRYVAGVGARFNLPFGPLRLDFSWAARPEPDGSRPAGRAQFAIGPAF